MMNPYLIKQRQEELLREAETDRQAKALRAARKRRASANRTSDLAWELKRIAGRLLKPSSTASKHTDQHATDGRISAPREEKDVRDLKYHVATTVDGFIAHEDGSADGFLHEGEHASDYLASLKNDYDVALMGRGTYEFGLRLGVTDPYPWMEQYVFSRTMERSPDPNVELVSEKAADLVRGLKKQEGKDVYLCGGADMAAALLAEDLIDEIVLKLNPVAFGSGVPLFSGAVGRTDLQLTDSKVYDNGVVLLRYRVKR